MIPGFRIRCHVSEHSKAVCQAIEDAEREGSKKTINDPRAVLHRCEPRPVNHRRCQLCQSGGVWYQTDVTPTHNPSSHLPRAVGTWRDESSMGEGKRGDSTSANLVVFRVGFSLCELEEDTPDKLNFDNTTLLSSKKKRTFYSVWNNIIDFNPRCLH